MLNGVTVKFTIGTTPFPDNVIVVGEFVALLVSVTFPLAAPPAAGMKTALNVVDCPAFSVSGSVRPVVEKPLPVTPELEMVTLVLPVFVTVIACEFIAPTVTSPKFTLVGLALSVRV